MSELVGAAGFARALHAAGLPVAPDSVDAFVRALTHVDLADRTQVYWAGRATLCRGPDEQPRYDLAFEAWFGGMPPQQPPMRLQRPRRGKVATLAQADGRRRCRARPATRGRRRGHRSAAPPRHRRTQCCRTRSSRRTDRPPRPAPPDPPRRAPPTRPPRQHRPAAHRARHPRRRRRTHPTASAATQHPPAEGGPAARHLRLHESLRRRAAAFRACRCAGESRRNRGLFARHPADPADPRAARARPRPRPRRGGTRGARLVRRYPAGRNPALVPRPVGAARPGARGGGGDLLRRLGAR